MRIGLRLWLGCLCMALKVLYAQSVVVTLQADLSSLPGISPNGVHLVGPFNNYNPGSDTMMPVGNGRFTRSYTLPVGNYLQYKFVNGNAYGNEEGVFGDCAFNTYRYLEVPTHDTILPWACFGYCDSSCSPAPGNRIACVGNSITWGYGLPLNIVQSYPSILQDSLGPAYLVTNFGAPGAAVIRDAGLPYVQTDLFRHAMHYDPATVLLQLGDNDSKAAIWDNWGSQFAADFDSLCMAFDTLASQPRMVICLPLAAFNPSGPLRDSVLAAAIVPAIKAHARLKAWDQIDLRGFTVGLGSLFPDGLHPGAAATIMIAREVQRILQMPKPPIQQMGNDLVAPPGFGWQWYFEGDTLAAALGGQSQILVAPPFGHYKVAVRVDSLYDHILISDTFALLTNIADAHPDGFQLFPNPARDQVFWQIAASAAVGEPVTMRLQTIDGRTVMQNTVQATSGHLDLHNLPPAIYLLEAHQGPTAWRRIVRHQ